jgi:hypothetical protein
MGDSDYVHWQIPSDNAPCANHRIRSNRDAGRSNRHADPTGTGETRRVPTGNGLGFPSPSFSAGVNGPPVARSHFGETRQAVAYAFD